MLKVNPPSTGYNKIGGGMYAQAYNKGELVEIVTKWHMSKGIKILDGSREIIIESRKLLPEKLKKYLPDIQRKRLDKSKSGDFEVVYEMPLLKKLEIKSDIEFFLLDDDNENKTKPESYENISKFYKSHGISLPKYEDFITIENTISRTASNYGIKLKFDSSINPQQSMMSINLKNISDGGGFAIFRDPAVAEISESDFLRLFGDKYPVDLSGKFNSLSLARYLSACMK